MISASSTINEALISPVRDIKAKVEIYNGSTLVETCYCEDRVSSLTVERIGEESKFFGFGVCQKLNVHLIDKDLTLSLSTANTIKVYLGANGEFVKAFPTFHITQVRRNELTKELSVTAYDALYSRFLVSDLDLEPPYNLGNFIAATGSLIGTDGFDIQNADASETIFTTVYAAGGNFDGSETLREALDDLAEVTTTIYFVDYRDKLVFKRLVEGAAANFTINKHIYFTLDNSTNRRLGAIAAVNELGNNVLAGNQSAGTTQYLRDNAFLELREDAGELLDLAIDTVYLLRINQFSCEWRGNFLTEVGDKISLVLYDDSTVDSFIINDSISYDGSLKETTSWHYSNDEELETNPSSLGEVLNKTYARVDKINREISLVSQETAELQSQAAQLQVSTDGISANVQEISTNLNDEITKLTEEVQASITAEGVAIAIQQELANGVDAVTTKTGFTFDADGLTINKAGSEMTTQVTENGMTIYRDDTEVLVVNNVGVEATNLHARTYLIIGSTSRLEDYENANGDTRTGCFWIG